MGGLFDLSDLYTRVRSYMRSFRRHLCALDIREVQRPELMLSQLLLLHIHTWEQWAATHPWWNTSYEYMHISPANEFIIWINFVCKRAFIYVDDDDNSVVIVVSKFCEKKFNFVKLNYYLYDDFITWIYLLNLVYYFCFFNNCACI